MIITNLSITNFRNYRGTNELDLKIDNDHNIILLGGQNGAGKTSMVDAIRLCLYGNRFDGNALSESKYQRYLDSVCNKDSDGRMSISLSIEMNEENPPISITIERNFTKTTDKFNEDLVLRKAGSKVEFIDHDYWEYYIEKIIPPASSRYFFFDGEKVRDTISSESSKLFLSEAVDNITGIHNLRVLKTDLLEIRKRILSKTKGSDSGIIASIKQSIESVQKEIEEKTVERQNNTDFLEQYNQKYSDLEEERSRLVGSTNKKREDILSRLEECRSNYDEANRIVSDFCYTHLPFFLASNSIKRTVDQAEIENSSEIYQYSVTALRNLMGDPAASKILGLSKKDTEKVLTKMIDQFSSNIQSIDRSLDITLTKANQIRDSIPTDADVDNFIESVHNREFFSQEMDKYNKKLSKLTDDSLKELDSSMSELMTEIEVLKRQIEIEDGQIQSLQTKESILKTDLNREERLLILEDVDRESLKNIDLVEANIDRRIEILTDDARLNMEKRINEIYHVLKNTKDMVKSIRLTDIFEIQLIDFENKVIDTAFISEGEKGILMYSAVYALHSISKSNFPLIVDSPLGRMDTKHVHNLAEKYFPTITSQIILLSHDREVVGESLEIIKEHISREYTIRKNDEPKVVQGYFE